MEWCLKGADEMMFKRYRWNDVQKVLIEWCPKLLMEWCTKGADGMTFKRSRWIDVQKMQMECCPKGADGMMLKRCK